MYSDFSRMCLDKIGFLPLDTFDYCGSDRHIDCPFYRTIHQIGFHCEFLDRCVIYKYFGSGDFEKFVEMTKTYCLTADNVRCERFKIRKTGAAVSEDLLPDGGTLKA